MSKSKGAVEFIDECSRKMIGVVNQTLPRDFIPSGLKSAKQMAKELFFEMSDYDFLNNEADKLREAIHDALEANKKNDLSKALRWRQHSYSSFMFVRSMVEGRLEDA